MPDRASVRDEMAEEVSLKRYIQVVRRRIWIILLCFVVTTTAAVLYTFKATPIYQTRARILIEQQTPHVTNWKDVQEVSAAGREYFETQCQLVRSKKVMQKALQEPELKDLPELKPTLARPTTWTAKLKETIKALLGAQPQPLPESWEMLRDRISVEPLRGTMLAEVKVEGPDPEHITLVANAVARAFEKIHLERKVQSSNDAFLFLDQQADRQRRQLVQAEQALQEFRESISVVPVFAEETENPVMTRLARLGSEATEVGLKRVELASQHQVIQSILESRAPRLEGQNEQLFSLPAVRADSTISALRTASARS